MFAWARERAKALDAEFASTGELKGPLHGVPVCHSVVIRAKRTLIPVATDEYKGSMYAVFPYICTFSSSLVILKQLKSWDSTRPWALPLGRVTLQKIIQTSVVLERELTSAKVPKK